MESLSPFLWGSCIPYKMPVYPGAQRKTPYPRMWCTERAGTSHFHESPTTRQTGLVPTTRA
jgi:hypothetical protein